jgi:hypothetical protein
VETIIEHAGFFIAGGIVTIVVALWAGYQLIKRLYRRIARGY